MSTADLDTLRALARLARLALTDEELQRFQADLGRILTAFEVLARHDAPQPAAGAPEPGRMRTDRPLPSLAEAELLAMAPAHEDGFYLVPKTVGGER